MPIKLRCFSCGKHLTVDEKYAGKRGVCPACAQVIMVPKVRQSTMLSVDYTTGPGYIPPRRGQVVGSSRAMRAKTISPRFLVVGIIVLLIGIGITFFGAKIPVVRNWLGYSVTIEEKEGEITSEGVATTEIEGAAEKKEEEGEEVEQAVQQKKEVEQGVQEEEKEKEEQKEVGQEEEAQVVQQKKEQQQAEEQQAAQEKKEQEEEGED